MCILCTFRTLLWTPKDTPFGEVYSILSIPTMQAMACTMYTYVGVCIEEHVASQTMGCILLSTTITTMI